MFRGNHPARVDEKGRLKLPAEFKRRVDEFYGPQFYITSKDGRRAEIYPLREWELIEAKLATIPSLTLPQLLRESAGATAEVVVLGAQTYLEVVNHDDFKTKLDAEPLSEADMAALADLGL